VKDARTGAYIASGTTVSVTFRGVPVPADVMYPTGAGADSLPIAVMGSAGTYGILVQRQGYADFTQNGIVVPDENGCGTQPVRMTVSLVPIE
jgi:hypothetical protein